MRSPSQIRRRAFLGAVGALGLVGAPGAKAEPSPAQLWTGLELQDTAGRSFSIGSLRAPLKLVKLWAYWCPACLGEMASLESMVAALGPSNIEVLLVSHPQDWARDQEAARRHHLPFRLATVSQANSPMAVQAALLDRDGAFVVPRALLFKGREGSLAWRHLGSMNWAGAVGELKSYLG